MKASSTIALVVSRSSTLQDGLLALMTTVPQVGVVLVAEDAASASRIAQTHHPALIVVDVPSISEVGIKEFIMTHAACFPIVALVDDTRQSDEAQAAGAERTLLKGFRVQEFTSVVTHVIACREKRIQAGANLEGSRTCDEDAQTDPASGGD